MKNEEINKINLLKPGNSVRVHFKIKEGEKTRTQVFEGVIISRHRRVTPDATITVRRLVKGQGVERIFPLHSPLIDKIEITKIAKRIRRANLSFLRERQGKSARLKETVLNDRIFIDLNAIFTTEEMVEPDKEEKVVETDNKEDVVESTEEKVDTPELETEDKETEEKTDK